MQPLKKGKKKITIIGFLINYENSKVRRINWIMFNSLSNHENILFSQNPSTRTAVAKEV